MNAMTKIASSSTDSAEAEVRFPADKILVSATDQRGVITFASESFCEVAGYTNDELMHRRSILVGNFQGGALIEIVEPETTAVNRLPMLNVEHADTVLLDGEWKFQLLRTPDSSIGKFHRPKIRDSKDILPKPILQMFPNIR